MEIFEKLEEQNEGDVVMSAITCAELRTGVERSNEREADAKALTAVVERIPVMPFNERAGTEYGILRAALAGRKRNALDRLIAAHALSLECILVTNNVLDFKDYPGVQYENWVNNKKENSDKKVSVIPSDEG